MNIIELEEYFKSTRLPAILHLDECTFLSDVKKCVDSNISYLKNHPGNRCYKPYYDQLILIKERLESP